MTNEDVVDSHVLYSSGDYHIDVRGSFARAVQRDRKRLAYAKLRPSGAKILALVRVFIMVLRDSTLPVTEFMGYRGIL